jgi:hypothetical protein
MLDLSEHQPVLVCFQVWDLPLSQALPFLPAGDWYATTSESKPPLPVLLH